MKYYSVAIDGPSGAGKSTIAKQAAQKLSYIYVDTGALYRAIGFFMASNGIDTTNGQAVSERLKDIKVTFKHIEGVQHVFVNGIDVSEKIRTPDMAMHASNVSAIKEVRDFLLDLQRDIAKSNNIIMDGRDIATVVLPNADVKIFLTATAHERANRRFAEHKIKGENVSYEEILEQIEKRDYNDEHRANAPLKQADDAVLIDTTNDTFQEALKRVLDTIANIISEEAL